jgi:hypothetical protein
VRSLVLLAGLAAVPAHADLYRWVDPESGSVKYSSVAPPWYGDPGRPARAPAVEVLPYQPLGAAPKKADEGPGPGGTTIPALEGRWHALLQAFSTLTKSDFERAGRGLGEQLQAYQALAAELDRQDPAGTARRRAQETAVMEKLQKGLEAQLSPRSPVDK